MNLSIGNENYAFHCVHMRPRGRFWQNGSPLSIYISTVTDVNECLTNNGGCSHQCVNMAGTHRCECPSGYTLHSNKQDCVNGEYI